MRSDTVIRFFNIECINKKILLLLLSVFLYTSAYSQKFNLVAKVPEVDFCISSNFMNNGNVFITSWSTGAYGSYNSLSVYTSDFKLYKTFDKVQYKYVLENSLTRTDHNREYVTQNFFNDDDLLEFVVDDGTNIVVKNENGETLFSTPKESSNDYNVYLTKIKDKKYFIISGQSDNFYSVYQVSAGDATSLSSTVFTKMNAFPNPADKEITIESNLKDAKAASVIVTDLNGKKCIEKDFISGSNKLDISSLSKGLYLYSVVTDQKELVGKGKFIVK